ncbi:MAG: hypothetical protein P8Y81_04310 [Ignavibacteriaceae bacterium]
MELIKTIDSDILFAFLGFIILVLLALVIYKFRNRAKKDRNLPLNYNQNKFGESVSKTSQIESTSTISEHNNASEKVNNPELPDQKFEVINNKTEEELPKNIHINYQSNAYKYYDETDSKKMFKLKVDSENPT